MLRPYQDFFNGLVWNERAAIPKQMNVLMIQVKKEEKTGGYNYIAWDKELLNGAVFIATLWNIAKWIEQMTYV